MFNDGNLFFINNGNELIAFNNNNFKSFNINEFLIMIFIIKSALKKIL